MRQTSTATTTALTNLGATGEDLATLKTFVLGYANDYGYDGSDTWDYDWTFPKSLLFTITIITTIGYGHIFPMTATGKLVCIIYSFIGIPLLLIFMTDISEAMTKHVTYIYSRLCCRWCRVRRRDDELAPDADRRQNSIRTDMVGDEHYMPTSEVRVPCMVTLIFMLAYIFVGSVAFTYAEEWPVGTAIYFCFVTLSTIGFGDFVPDKTFVKATEEKNIGGMLMMAFTIGYCIFGIMLLSLSLGLMQKQIMEKLESIGKVLGMDGENKNEEIVKRFKQNRINKTPIGMTGNELNFNQKRAGVYRVDSDSEIDFAR